MSGQWARLQQQLSNFGYLADEDVVEVANDGDISAALIAAIAAAQEDVSETIVEPAGRLDDINVYIGIAENLEGRFCGVPDRGGEIGPQTFGSPGGRWTRAALNVSIDDSGCNFIRPALRLTSPRGIIQRAFTRWQAASNFF